MAAEIKVLTGTVFRSGCDLRASGDLQQTSFVEPFEVFWGCFFTFQVSSYFSYLGECFAVKLQTDFGLKKGVNDVFANKSRQFVDYETHPDFQLPTFSVNNPPVRLCFPNSETNCNKAKTRWVHIHKCCQWLFKATPACVSFYLGGKDWGDEFSFSVVQSKEEKNQSSNLSFQ